MFRTKGCTVNKVVFPQKVMISVEENVCWSERPPYFYLYCKLTGYGRLLQQGMLVSLIKYLLPCTLSISILLLIVYHLEQLTPYSWKCLSNAGLNICQLSRFHFSKIMQEVDRWAENALYLIEFSNPGRKLSLNNRKRPILHSPIKPRIRVFPLTSPDFRKPVCPKTLHCRISIYLYDQKVVKTRVWVLSAGSCQFLCFVRSLESC